MKHPLSAFLILSLLASPTYATSKIDNSLHRTRSNAIEVANKTNHNVVYQMLSSSAPAMYYGVKRGDISRYHAKPGDGDMTILVGKCKQLNYATGLCIKFNNKGVKNCVGHKYYNAHKIDSVIINSLSSCTVKCDDGGSTSCLSDPD